MFKIGDVVVYPGCGVGKILAIEEQIIEGRSIKTYIFKPLDNETQFYIPVESAKKIGLRAIIQRSEALKVYDILAKREVNIPNGNWNKRYREYTERLKSGELTVIASLVRELYEISKRKPLSYGERRIFEKARELLITELSICENCSIEEMERKIKTLLEG